MGQRTAGNIIHAGFGDAAHGFQGAQQSAAALDYLIIDLPPGTGDAQLTLAQRVALAGAVIVSTPQDIALLDARKGLKMFEKVGVPILGIVENMAVHVCSNCGHAEHIFGAEGGKKMASEYGVDYLGALPLNLSIRVQADAGRWLREQALAMRFAPVPAPGGGGPKASSASSAPAGETHA